MWHLPPQASNSSITVQVQPAASHRCLHPTAGLEAARRNRLILFVTGEWAGSGKVEGGGSPCPALPPLSKSLPHQWIPAPKGTQTAQAAHATVAKHGKVRVHLKKYHS